jgi:Flp pilus assembly pilin Flp
MQRLSTITGNQPEARSIEPDATNVGIADARGQAAGGPLERLHHDEEGAQAVEYAMIAGLGAGVIGILYKIITSTSLIERLVTALLEALIQLVTSWF